MFARQGEVQDTVPRGKTTRRPDTAVSGNTIERSSATGHNTSGQQRPAGPSSGENGPPRANETSLSRPATAADPVAANSGGTAIDDILYGSTSADTHIPDSLRRDTLPIKNFLDMPISGKSKDSLRYSAMDRKVYIYREGDIAYGQGMNLKADYTEVTIATKELYAYGYTDSLGVKTRPVLEEGTHSYVMDTVSYNITSGKAKIKGVTTNEGDGILHGESIKKRKDNTSDIINGKYTTCDDEHPHFYLNITQGKLIPNDKVIVGPSWLVIEDIPLFPLVIPEAFFPLTNRRSAGIIVPNFGEENARGFYFRDAGWYMPLGDHMDMTLRGSLYTKGSWEARANSRYTKRYKFAGSFDFNYSKFISGEKGMSDYQNSNSYEVRWEHRLDPKAKPGTNFSANVNFQTTNYAKYGAETLGDYLNASSSSTITYSKSWAGTPFSLSASLRLDQNRKDSTYSFNFPTVHFGVGRINPFKRKNAVGKERWYEKIAMTYSADMTNNVKVKEADVLKEQMFKDMKYGVKHAVSINAPFNILGYINFTPNASYNENWYFQKENREWDYIEQKQVVTDTTYGFYRVYNYGFSGNATTKIYGDWEIKNKNFFLRKVRHVITPTIGFSWAPDFGGDKYGFYKPIQKDSTGAVEYYSPYSGQAYPVPQGGRNGSITFSLSQTLEAKIKDDSDSTGERKIKFIDELGISGSYNLLAEEYKLSNLALRLRLTVPGMKNFQLNLSATLDPYRVVVENGVRTRKDQLAWGFGKIGRITQTGWSFDYTFNGGKEAAPGAINDTAGYDPLYDSNNPFYFDPNNPMDPLMRRQMMTKTYYDFSVPWSLTFGYTVTYTDNLTSRKFSQSLRFNGSVSLTPKWAITMSGFTFDFDNMMITPGSFSLTRNLHCWQMSFNWMPFGARKSWSFSINVLSSMLKDLKYDKSSSQHDNIYHQSAARQ